MNYHAYLSSLEKFGMRLGLERIHYLLDELNHPEQGYDSILIAGTNGKGSVAAMLASILAEAGIVTGLYTSPHLFDFTERIKVNGKDIQPKDLDRVVLRVKKIADKMDDLPTIFEVLTAAALLYFKEQGVEVTILEVGLGGTYDATNAVEHPILSIITQIGLDHTEVLGKTVLQITADKAGIIKPGVEVVIGDLPKEAKKVVLSAAQKQGSKIFLAKNEQIKLLYQQLNGQKIRVGKETFFLPLVGQHQRDNLAVVLAAVERLIANGYGITMKALKSGIKKTCWPLRFQVISKEPLMIIDAAHNPQGAKALVETIKSFKFKKPLVFYLGILKRKDYQGIIKEFAKVADHFLVTGFNCPEAASLRLLLSAVRRATDVPVGHLPIKGAKKVIQQKYKNSVICIAGSIYFGAEFLKTGR